MSRSSSAIDMKLLTEQLRKQLPALYANENNKTPTNDIIAYARFFGMWTNWVWYACEAAEDGDLVYGFVIGHYPEWGYFQLSELEAIRGPGGLRIERDLHFVKAPMWKTEPQHFSKRGG